MKTNQNNDLRSEYLKHAFDLKQTKEPIYASCPNEGQCFCTGACREIIGWREKTNTTLKDILNKH